jgi:ribosomal protein S18 acetylase RimI-like enzyme
MSDPADGIRIRRGGPSDVPRLAPLFDAYLEFYHRPSNPTRTRAFLTERLERGESVVFLAEGSDGEALGFTQLYPTFASLSLRPWWVLYDLFVAPNARRRGIASRLLDRAKSLAHETGAAGISLETAKDNPAQVLYRALGWAADEAFIHFELYL